MEGERLERQDDGKYNSWISKVLHGTIIPTLTTEKGKRRFSVKKSIAVVTLLYLSHSFSAWGDRMWGFAVSLFMVLLYPGSLLLPGIHGFIVQVTVAMFGTVVGDWVDYYSRMKVITASLVIQNGLLVISSVVMAVMFYFDLNVCSNVLVFCLLTVVIILLTSGANLATVANTISIEKDWIVVIADGNEDTLAVLNANMRRIDLCCKLLAPAATGVILQHTGPFSTTVIVAVWNLVSFFGELGLLWIVYKLIPNLAIKKVRNVVEVKESDENAENDKESTSELIATEAEAEALIDDDDSEENNIEHVNKSTWMKYCSMLLTYPSKLKEGFKIFIKQEIALVGFSMASLYLTVLGFSGVTSSYFLTQGLRSDLIGVFQGVGAIFGVSGTILYPFLRKKVGTIRSGLFGISLQLLILLFCIASIIVPSNKISNEERGYYSPDCRNYINNDTSNVTDTVLMSSTMCTSETKHLSTSLPIHITMDTAATSSYPIPLPPSNCSPSPPSVKNNSHIHISLVLMLMGVIGCRIGLWTFDLAVQQLIQENVVQEERGVVSGVMSAMNSAMDMLHYVLVIVAPRPENFNILTVISFVMVAIGWLFYSIYVRKSRGHFFHIRDYSTKFLNKRKNVRLDISMTNEENEDEDNLPRSNEEEDNDVNNY